MRISDWSSDVCSSDLFVVLHDGQWKIKHGDRHSHPYSTQREAIESAIEAAQHDRSEEHTSELQSLMRISYAVFCLKKKNIYKPTIQSTHTYIIERHSYIQLRRNTKPL